MARRSRLDITTDMLASLSDNGGSLRVTKLMYKSNMSHPQMKGYLDELYEKGFCTEESSGRSTTVRITDAGRQFLEKLREIQAFEESFGV